MNKIKKFLGETLVKIKKMKNNKRAVETAAR